MTATEGRERPIGQRRASAPRRAGVALLAALALAAASCPVASLAASPGADWRARAGVHALRFLRFPPGGPRDEDHFATVRFVLDRRGAVRRARLVRSTGSAILDRAALACVRRANPFPRPPAVGRDGDLTVTLPIRFAAGGGAED